MQRLIGRGCIRRRRGRRMGRRHLALMMVRTIEEGWRSEVPRVDTVDKTC